MQSRSKSFSYTLLFNIRTEVIYLENELKLLFFFFCARISSMHDYSTCVYISFIYVNSQINLIIGLSQWVRPLKYFFLTYFCVIIRWIQIPKSGLKTFLDAIMIKHRVLFIYLLSLSSVIFLNQRTINPYYIKLFAINSIVINSTCMYFSLYVRA